MATIILGHAMMVDRRVWKRKNEQSLLYVLLEAGFRVVLFDCRGHGESVPRAEDGGRWSYDDIVKLDMPAMIRAARSVAEGRPVGVVGHSLVGHAAMIFAGLSPAEAPDAIVGLAANLWAPHLEPQRRLRHLKTFRLWTMRLMTQGRGFFNARGLRQGSANEAAPYVEQFWHMWRNDRLGAARDATDYEQALQCLSIPVLAFSSVGDRVLANPASVSRFLALMPSECVVHRVLTSTSGAPDHMGFVRDASMAPMWQEATEWLRDTLVRNTVGEAVSP